MVKRIALLAVSVALLGTDCGTDPTEVESNQADRLIGQYAYFRTSGNAEAQWIISCDRRDSAPLRVGCGTFWGTIWVNDDLVWRLNVDMRIEIPFSLSSNTVVFTFDDGLEPRRSSQTGNLSVEGDRVIRIEGQDWFARRCYTSCFGS